MLMRFRSMDEGVTFLVGKGKKAEKFLVHKGQMNLSIKSNHMS